MSKFKCQKRVMSHTFEIFTKRCGGNAWVGLLIMLVFIITLGVALVADVTKTITQTKRAEQTVVAQSLCDAGVEKAMWKLNQTGGSYTGETDINMTTGTLDIAITNIDAENKSVLATAYVPNKTAPKVTREVKAKISATPNEQSVSFNYAIQGGAGGIVVAGSSRVEGNLYSNGGITVGGSAYVNGDAAAHTTVSPNPNPKISGTITEGVPTVPLPSVDIDAWKAYAEGGGTITGNYSVPSGTTNLGPKKITGNFDMFGSGKTLNLTGPLWIQGNMSFGGSDAKVKLSDIFGSKGTVIIVDGTVTIAGSGPKFVTNASGGYIMVVSTSSSGSAITYAGSGDSDTVVMYALNGGMTLAGSGEIVAMCANTLTLAGSGEIKYKSGLASAIFTSGPGGSWQIKEWQVVH